MKKWLTILWLILTTRREPKLQEVRVECRRF